MFQAEKKRKREKQNKKYFKPKKHDCFIFFFVSFLLGYTDKGTSNQKPFCRQ